MSGGGNNKLLSAKFVAAFVFIFLLATQVPFAYAATKVVTANGNARISTAQSKFGGASGYFDGSGSYLSTSDSSDFAFGTGDFTIDFWLYHTSTPSTWTAVISKCTKNTWDAGWALAYYGGWVFYSPYGTPVTSPAYASSSSAWHHMAIVRATGTITMYVDGVSRGTSTQASSIDTANALAIAGQTGGGYYFNGYIDELRISKGVARWTSSFSPPTAAYSTGSGDDDNVVLLMHMNGAEGSTTFTDDHQTGPPPSDFSISASPTSQSVGAGASASYTLTLTASSTYGGGTVSLFVTSGLPSGATGTITPNSISLAASETKTATLSVSTSITTPGGTSSIVVTATDGAKTHTVTVGLTVSAPASYSFNVKAGATQIVVTLTYSWSGSGSLPLGSITIVGPGGTPTLSESGAVVYDRTSITVSGSTSTYSIIHRATFTVSGIGSAQTWTALISLSGVTNYNIAIEVS